MNLQFNTYLADSYKSNSQKIRVLTENWIAENMFCPVCGNPVLNHYEVNKPVADFYCCKCHSEYELKSKSGKLGKRIADGAYETMIERITSFNNPNFFFLTYDYGYVNDILLIPSHFFIPEIIEKRNPLSENARRAGWIGCNIKIESIPDNGKIFIVKDGKEINRQSVIENYKRTEFLRTRNLDNRGWILDILRCVEQVPQKEFSLGQIYDFVDYLQMKHPANNNIEAKIRQQLQYLRDKGLIQFISRGKYRKL